MVEQYLVTFSWLLLALQVKVGKVASFVGTIFMVQSRAYEEKRACNYNLSYYKWAGFMSKIVKND